MNKLGSIIRTVISVFSKQCAAWLVFIMMLLVISEGSARYLFNKPLMLADEIGGYLLAVIAAFGLAYTWEAHGHIRVTVIVTRIPVSARKWLRLITLLMATALTGVLFKGSYELVAFSATFGRRSDTWLRVPLAWPQVALFIGFGFLFLYQLVHVARAIKTLRTPGGEAD